MKTVEYVDPRILARLLVAAQRKLELAEAVRRATAAGRVQS